MKSKQSGFTLIEMASVLFIMALMLAAALKGQEFINSVKVKKLASDFNNISLYVDEYQDKFKALPGDDINAASHLGAAVTAPVGNGNSLIDGQWDVPAVSAATPEPQLFWYDVILANLANGNTNYTANADFLPQNTMGGVVGITSANSGNNPDTVYAPAVSGTYVVCSSNILGKYAQQLDIQLDDGIYNTGLVRAYTQSSRGQPLTAVVAVNGQLDPSAIYTVCMGI